VGRLGLVGLQFSIRVSSYSLGLVSVFIQLTANRTSKKFRVRCRFFLLQLWTALCCQQRRLRRS